MQQLTPPEHPQQTEPQLALHHITAAYPASLQRTLPHHSLASSPNCTFPRQGLQQSAIPHVTLPSRTTPYLGIPNRSVPNLCFPTAPGRTKQQQASPDDASAHHSGPVLPYPTRPGKTSPDQGSPVRTWPHPTLVLPTLPQHGIHAIPEYWLCRPIVGNFCWLWFLQPTEL